MLQRLRIGSRLILTFTLMLVLLAAVAGVAMSRLEQLSEVTRTLVQVRTQKQYWSQMANQHALIAANSLLALLQTARRDLRVPLYQQMDWELDATDQAIRQLEQLLNHHHASIGGDEQAALTRIIKLRLVYREHFLGTVNLIELSGIQSARKKYEQGTRQALQALLAETTSFSQLQQDRLHQELHQLQEKEQLARITVVTQSLLALLFGVALAWRITRGITRSVRKAAAVANAITQGDLLNPVPDGGSDEVGQLLSAMAVMRDAIASREAHISRLAYSDDLTGLPNRTRLLALLQQQRVTQPGALLIFDIDRFAIINQALGEEVADRLLREVGVRLVSLLQNEQLLVRLWSDQFAFWLPDMSVDEVRQFTDRLSQLQRTPVVLDAQRLDIEGKLGIAMYPQDGANGPILLRNAALALRQAKAQRLSVLYFAETAGEPKYERLSLLGEMRDALLNDEFVIFYQPKFNLGSGKMVSVEALIRWRHPQRGIVPPGHFIPFAEQTGFIREITPWVLDRVLADTAMWRQQGFQIVSAVNLSVHDLMNVDLPAQVEALLLRHGLVTADLTLEITESALMEDPAQALQVIRALDQLGVKMAIDDYGTGQASLAYLKVLPVRELKIDRMFVDQVSCSTTNSAIVSSTIQLAHSLGMSVVAEGAETLDDFAWLRANACDLVQGYVVAKPMLLAELLVWQPAARLLPSRLAN